MSEPPDLHDLLGDLPPDERARVRRAHELLRSVPPPPEIPPSLTASVQALARPRTQRRGLLLAASLALSAGLAAGAFALGQQLGGDDFRAVDGVTLAATPAAPGARMVIEVGPLDEAGNWPLLVTVSGLPALPDGGFYELWLTKGRRLAASCGRFSLSRSRTVRVRLNAPYRFARFDRWVVVADVPGRESAWLLEGPLSAPS
ncbi:MAG: anti-sigma factor domain-containing protein [Thermoleophilaceae bacterium]